MEDPETDPKYKMMDRDVSNDIERLCVVLICSSYWVRCRLKIPEINVTNLDFSVIGFQYIKKLKKVDYIIVAFSLLRYPYNIRDVGCHRDFG